MPDDFDLLMISACNILEKVSYGSGADDVYGQPPQELRTKITAWPCRVSTMKGGREWKIGKEFSKNTFTVFMRPPTQDDSGVPFSLTPHNWIRVGTALFNILGVNDPSLLGHHLEVAVEQVIP